jgi:serine/threonine-protein kinase
MLAPGTRLGAYEVIAPVGAGGMGEVYRATDVNLGRHVAIKVLPEAFGQDPERIARFEREAKTLASLNHPNIAIVHGLEKTGGTIALVMELVEGEDLSDRIARGPVPLDEALPIAKQIAEALEAAHEQGIVHRDLKPANIKVRSDGTVKVLDFGLAKLTEPAGSRQVAAASAQSLSPTITSPAMMTGVGMLLGTAAYMSPEQAKGKPADKRSDIWAFGCVLYEMVTGKRAFAGDDVPDTLVAVLRDDPDWSAVPAHTPVGIRQALRLCLQRDPKQRAQAIGDVRLALAGAFDIPVPHAAPAAAARPRGRIAALTAGAVMIAGAAVAVTWLVMRPVAPRVIRGTITADGPSALSINGNSRDLAVTRDGSRVVYRGNGQILVRALDQLEPARLAGAGNSTSLFVSPDGQWVGFFDNGAIKKVAITGGPPVTVANVENAGGGRGATWGEDDTIVFATAYPNSGLLRVSAAGGNPTVLTMPNREKGERNHLWPEFLPGRQAVLFTIMPASGTVEDRQVAVLDLRSGTQKVLIGGSNAHYVPSGHLVYSVAGTLRAIAFDPERLEVRGTAVPVIPQLFTGLTGIAEFDIAANGTLVYMAGGITSSQVRRTLVWVNRQGRPVPLRLPERAYLYPRVSPDGTRVAISINDQQVDIWVLDIARETLTRMTFTPDTDQYPAWTPDGRSLLFASGGVVGSGAGINVFRQAADGSGSPEQLTRSADGFVPYSVAPDSSRVVLRAGTATYDLAVMLLGEGHRTEPLIRTPYSELNAEISPDGRWLAYESNESGEREIYVRPFPNVDGGRWQVSTAGGTRPLWARSGRELFYLAISGTDATVMSVPVERSAGWSAGTPAKLFSGRFYFTSQGPGEGRTYDVSPDGQRFLMIQDRQPDPVEAAQNFTFVEHFDEELKRLVPVK